MRFDQDIAGYLRREFSTTSWPGMGCALLWGDHITSFCCGVADLAQAAPVEKHSLFNIASVGKLLTTVSILALIETGHLSLETALGDLLQDIPSAWKKVQIVHLLTHSSGISNYTDTSLYWKEVEADVSRERILGYVKAYPLECPPGTRWHYSNTGFFLLGLVTEAVSRMAYFDFVHRLIESYKPGLRIFPTQDCESMQERVTGYEIAAGTPVKTGYYSPQGTFSAGGYSVSLPDFLDFEKGLFTGRILSRPLLEILTRSYQKPDGEILRSSDPDFGFEMTHGLFKFKKNGHDVLAHRGETRGFSSCYKRIAEKDLAVIAAVNVSDIDRLDHLTDRILEMSLAKSG